MLRKRKTSDDSPAEADVRLAELQDEQGRISAELESVFLSYDKKTRELSKRLASAALALSSPSADEGAERFDQKEAERVREEQNGLWRAIRRAQAAARTTGQLERELAEWTDGRETSAARTHPDHPLVRAEIAASELRVRGRDPSGLFADRRPDPFEGSARDVDPLTEALEFATVGTSLASDSAVGAGSPRPPEQESEEGPPAPSLANGVAEWRAGSDEHLIREIIECCREIRRTSAHRDRGELAGELATMFKDLRMYHAHLRKHDRKAGIRRYRFVMGPGND
jgi:hypothetical protein